jgi:hypothetical protein
LLKLLRLAAPLLLDGCLSRLLSAAVSSAALDSLPICPVVKSSSLLRARLN